LQAISDQLMRRRPMGAGGPDVGVIGFGGWGIGGRTPGNSSYGETEDDVSRATIQRAVERGVTLFDTSPAYGDGRSESLLGEVLEPIRDRVQIATKVGYRSWTEPPDFSVNTMRGSLHGSLDRLRTDRVDLVWLHSPAIELLLETPEIFDALDRMVSEDLVSRWGVSCKSPEDALRLLDVRPVDLFQVNMNMLDIRILENGLVERAEREGVGIVVRTPLCFGFLTGTITPKTVFPEGDHRRAWSSDQIQAWVDGALQALSIVGATPGAQACAAALRFCLSFPAVCSVLPGAIRPTEMDEQADAALYGPLEVENIAAIIELNRAKSFFVG
jgi:aryl-alcohol dehydrogenase-like predicted oxidoreductase